MDHIQLGVRFTGTSAIYMTPLNNLFGRKIDNASEHPFEQFFVVQWTWEQFRNCRYRKFPREARHEFQAIFAFGMAIGIIATLVAIGLVLSFWHQ